MAHLERGVRRAPNQAAHCHAARVHASHPKHQLRLGARRCCGRGRQGRPVGRQDVVQRAALLRLIRRTDVEDHAVAALQRRLPESHAVREPRAALDSL